MVLFTLMLTFLIIPLAGLAIDVTKLYIVQAKLSAAVDGAALGAGRLLGTKADTEEIAREFLHANFPDKYWGSTLTEPTAAEIHYWKPNLNTHQIDIAAHADVPLWFLQLFQSTAAVAASATATRKDTRIILVLDRTNSMNHIDPTTGATVVSAAIIAAKTFTNMFIAGTDEMGLVVFATSGIVAYPPYTAVRPYNTDPGSAGGPDTGFLTANGHTYAQAAGPMMDTLGVIAANGNTGMAEGLALAYIEMLKAHNRDLAAYGDDRHLNTIVLMTDGVPNQITAYLNNPAGTSISSASPCTYKTATPTVPSTQMIGSMGNYFPASGRPPAVSVTGFWRLAWKDTNSTLAWVKLSGLDDTDNITPTTPVNGPCSSLPNSVGYQSSSHPSDLTRIPPTDYWGNSTGGTAYTKSHIVQNGAPTSPSTVYNGTLYDPTKITSTNASTAGYHMNLAAWNAVDNAGLRIRTDPSLPIAIYTIGYEGTGGCDEGLLLRLANDEKCDCHVPVTQQTGRYVSAKNTAELNSAFVTVASELLRLAR